MRIRIQFAAAFAVLLVVAASVGLAPSKFSVPQYGQSDKVLHFLTFFLLSVVFYWILETNRRRQLHITLFVCTAVLGVGSEIVQGLLPNGREFDPFDIGANIGGSLAAVGLCTWYHKRMLERKRLARTSYTTVPGENPDDDRDLELGENIGEQETGVTGVADTSRSLEAEVDNWDENAEDWDEDDDTAGESKPNGNSTEDGAAEPKKRTD